MNDKHYSTEIPVVINGKNTDIKSDNHVNLLSFLRNELKLTGSRQGCVSGHCGACSVLIDGVASPSCQIGTTALEKNDIETIEYIVQQALGEKITSALNQYDAAQCGYCLPGIVVAAYSEMVNAERPDPVQALQRNLCRCGSHSRILKALQDVMATHDPKDQG